MWHADMFKTAIADPVGPFLSHQTAYKYATIMKDVQINIQKLAPKLKLATAAAVTGGMDETKFKWWGGNLKNVWNNVNKFFPEVPFSDFWSLLTVLHILRRQDPNYRFMLLRTCRFTKPFPAAVV